MRVLPVVGQHGVRQPSQGLRLRDVDVQQPAVKVRDETRNKLRSELLLFMFSPQLVPPESRLFYFLLELVDLFQFSLPTVLGGDLVLTPPPDISADVKLLL